MYSDLKRPYDRSYWVVPGLLLAGCYPGDRHADVARTKMTSLLGVGVRSVVNLMEENETGYGGEPFTPYLATLEDIAADMSIPLTFRRFPVRDGFPPAVEYANQILDHIDSQILAGIPTYVHCWGGRGRTGTIVACYLLRHRTANITNVIKIIQQLRLNDKTGGPAPETRAQHEFLEEFAETLA